MVQRRNPHPPPTHGVWWVYPAPPPVGLWCWVVVLAGSVGLFASVLLVGVLCTPPPPLWPCGGPAVLAYIHTYVRTYIHTYIRTYIHTYNHFHAMHCL